MDLKLEGSDLQKLIEGAVLTALGEAGREALVKEVLRHLVTEGERNSYSGKPSPSPLVEAMRTASERIAARVLTEKLEKDEEFIAQVQSIYLEAVQRFFHSKNREEIVERMASKLGDAFAGRGY